MAGAVDTHRILEMFVLWLVVCSREYNERSKHTGKTLDRTKNEPNCIQKRRVRRRNPERLDFFVVEIVRRKYDIRRPCYDEHENYLILTSATAIVSGKIKRMSSPFHFMRFVNWAPTANIARVTKAITIEVNYTHFITKYGGSCVWEPRGIGDLLRIKWSLLIKLRQSTGRAVRRTLHVLIVYFN